MISISFELSDCLGVVVEEEEEEELVVGVEEDLLVEMQVLELLWLL